LVVTVMLSVVWRYGLWAGLVRPDASDEAVETLTRRLTPSLAGDVALIVMGFFLPVIPRSGPSPSPGS
jgi:hypothetical protein